MSIKYADGRVITGTTFADWKHNLGGNGREWCITYEGDGKGMRVAEDANQPEDLLDQWKIYRQFNPQMAIRIMHRNGRIFDQKVCAGRRTYDE